VVLGIRAEHLCGSGDFLDRHPECALRGRLEFTELRGAETYHYVRIAGREVVVRVSWSKSNHWGTLAYIICYN